MDFAGFEWDPAKDLENYEKHGVHFAQAQLAFADERRVVEQDSMHSGEEPRFYCVGRVGLGIMTVRFTWRSGAIRIIGAGFWRKGKIAYERENSLYR